MKSCSAHLWQQSGCLQNLISVKTCDEFCTDYNVFIVMWVCGVAGTVALQVCCEEFARCFLSVANFIRIFQIPLCANKGFLQIHTLLVCLGTFSVFAILWLCPCLGKAGHAVSFDWTIFLQHNPTSAIIWCVQSWAHLLQLIKCVLPWRFLFKGLNNFTSCSHQRLDFSLNLEEVVFCEHINLNCCQLYVLDVAPWFWSHPLYQI